MRDHGVRYPWARLWYSRERPVEPGPDEFTLVREYERWSPEGPRLLTFPEISHHQVLILLGDAGAGKTRSLTQEAAELRARLAETEDVVRWVNLAGFQSETELVEEVFRHPDVTRCMSGSGRLHLFFDSFDEGIIRLGTLSAVLGRQFERADRSRMEVRIVSRPAVWPPELKETLVALFEAENVGTYVLAPLTRDDAATAARLEGLDPEMFLSEVRRLNVGPLAAKPITLRMLLDQFPKAGPLPGRQTDLYREGCRRLCQEWRPSRQYPADRPRRLSAEQTMDVAARIAAAAVLSGRLRIWTARDHGGARDGHVTIPELCAGAEPNARLAEAEIWETLESGLFTGAGDGVLEFTHRSFAEFLAAYHLHQQGVAGFRLHELLTVQIEGEPWLVPHLTETAAWLEALSPGTVTPLLEAVAEEWVMGSAEIPPVMRERATAALLGRYEAGETYDVIDVRPRYVNLCHAGIGAQIRPYLVEAAGHPIARRAAAAIAGACGASGLQEELADLALDATAAATVRQNAIRALAEVGNDPTLERLRPLAIDPVGEDADDEIKGAALTALWPRLLDAEEVLAALTPRKEPRLTGSYVLFATSGFAAGIPLDQLPVALRWLAASPAKTLRGKLRADIARSLIRAAFPHLLVPDVLSAVSELAIAMLAQSEGLLVSRIAALSDESDFPASDESRRQLIAAIIARSPDPDLPPRMVWRRPPLALGSDLPWLSEQAETAPEAERPAWRNLVEAVRSSTESGHDHA